MQRTLKIGTAIAALLAIAPMAAVAQEATTPATEIQANTAATVDAGKLIGRDVVDASGATIGEIDSVLVNDAGKVTSVVVDVSSWLEAEKLISMRWSELTVAEDGDITASLTKDSATALPTYEYQDKAQRGTVIADNPMVDAGTGGTGVALGTPVMNGDGSFNGSQLIGLDVQNGAGETVGEIDELVVDGKGAVNGVVVDVGGFLGVGARPVLMKWQDVSFAGANNDIKAIVNATEEQMKSLPEYRPAKN